MNKIQKMKRSVRSSKAWKEFRKFIMNFQKGNDLISQTKLTGRWAVHHKILTDSEDIYGDLSRPEMYLACIKSIHDTIHLCLKYIKKEHSMDFMKRLYKEVEAEAILNGFIN